MSESTKTILTIGGILAVWHLFLRDRIQPLPTQYAPAPTNQYGSLAGYAPMPGNTNDPGDRNNYIPGIIQGLTSLGAGIANAVAQNQSSSVSTGQNSGSNANGWTDISDAEWYS